MSEENKTLIRRWFDEVWNKGRADAIDEMFAANGIAHGLSDDSESPLVGPEAFKVFHAKSRDAFPDIIVTVEDMVAEGDRVAARCSVRGKHTGDSLGFPGTNSPIGNYRYDDRPGQRWKDRASLEQLRFSKTLSATRGHLALGKSPLLFRILKSRN
jgi:hypothetical protein